MHAQVSKVGCPFRVVIIESSASEDHLRASMEVPKSPAKPRRFLLGTEASKFTSFSCCVYQAAEDILEAVNRKHVRRPRQT